MYILTAEWPNGLQSSMHNAIADRRRSLRKGKAIGSIGLLVRTPRVTRNIANKTVREVQRYMAAKSRISGSGDGDK
jgi:hypothetical protein